MQNMTVVLNLSWTNYGNRLSNEFVFVGTLKSWSNLLELHGEAVREYAHYSFCPCLTRSFWILFPCSELEACVMLIDT